MAEHRDMNFESFLRSSLRAEADSLPVSVGPSDILRRRLVLKRQRVSRRLRLLLIAALLALPLGALAIGALRLDPAPAAYRAVLVGGLGGPAVHVSLASEGSEQRVLEVPAARLGAVAITGVLEVSPTGWIALETSPETGRENIALLDLRHPDKTAVVREGTSLGAFTSDGFYWSATNSAYELIDPASGDVISWPRSVTEDLDWWRRRPHTRMMVAATGSGLLVGSSGNTVHNATGVRYPQQWGVLSPAGTMTRGLPQLAEGVGPRLISPDWGLLQQCEPAAGYGCPGLRTGSIISGPARDGSYRQWGGEPPAHDHVIEASWAVDRGLWLLVDRRVGGRTIVLIHRDEHNVDREVGSFAVEHDVHVSFGDLAPDDSLIALNVWTDWPRWQTVIIDTRSGQSHLFDAAVGGFVPAAVSNEWASGEQATVAGQLLERPTTSAASGPAYRPLLTLQEQLYLLGPIDSTDILLVHEFTATTADPGPTLELTLGPVELDEGIGLMVTCSGPSDITVTPIFQGGADEAETYSCLSLGGARGYGASPSVRIRIEYDPSTSWRLVIFDPPPPGSGL
jgi:hypothetical protein